MQLFALFYLNKISKILPDFHKIRKLFIVLSVFICYNNLLYIFTRDNGLCASEAAGTDSFMLRCARKKSNMEMTK